MGPWRFYRAEKGTLGMEDSICGSVHRHIHTHTVGLKVVGPNRGWYVIEATGINSQINFPVLSFSAQLRFSDY